MQPLLFRHLVDERLHLAREVVLHFVLQLLDLGLRVLLEALQLHLLLLDLFFELPARGVAHHAAARLELLLVVLQRLLTRAVLVLLLVGHGLHTRERGLTFGRLLEDALRVDEGDFRTGRKRRGRLGGHGGWRLRRRRLRRGRRRCRPGRLGGWRLGKGRGQARDNERKRQRGSNRRTLHYTESFRQAMEALDSTVHLVIGHLVIWLLEGTEGGRHGGRGPAAEPSPFLPITR